MDYRLEKTEGQPYRRADGEIERIVGELRDSRTRWRQNAQLCGADVYELPSQEVLSDILEALTAALFPRHFGPTAIAEDSVDAFVARSLESALDGILEQVRRELRLAAATTCKSDDAQEQRAQEITRAFAAHLPKVRALLESDIQAAFEGDPAARSVDEVLLCYPCVGAIVRHRLAHVLYRLGAPLLARMIAELAHSATGIDIHPGAQIGGRFFIDHGTGVVIGETAVIGTNVRLYQAVTLGAKRFAVDENGALLKGGARHPIIEDDVVIYAGATILGRITIGRGSTIGGNVWLTHSVPAGSNITQAQARSDVFVDGGGI